MFTLSSHLQYHLYSDPTDMRKGFDGLSGLVKNHLGQSPTNGDVFIFLNKNRNKVKLLHWSGSGFVLYYKRLEKGHFQISAYDITDGSIKLGYAELVMLIDGISISNIQRKERFQLK